MRVLGVDPGQTGGLAIVEASEGLPRIVGAILMPTMEVRTKKALAPREIIDWYTDAGGAGVGVVELVHSMPKQGVASSFQFGRMFGAVEALVSGMVNRIDYATPRVWKQAMGLGSNKGASRDLASRLLGSDAGAEFWPRAGDDGVAEAALIAVYYLRKLGAST